MKISVIIPTRNRSELLKETLNGLCDQTAYDHLREVIVVDDGSVDSTLEVVKEFNRRLPLLYLHQMPSGVSVARNRGMRMASAPVLLFLDDDVVPSPRLVAEHVSFHEEHLGPGDALLGYVKWHPKVHITPFMLWYGEYGALFGYSLLNDNQEAPPRFLYTCNVSFKTEFLSTHNGFDETLTVMEDHELGYRLTKSGMKMTFRKSALGYHNQTFTFDQACQRLERYSPGLNAFLQTEAGKTKARQRASPFFRIAEAGAMILATILSPLRAMIDTNVRLPNVVYRLLYAHYGAHRSFWHRSTSRSAEN
jgi:glycosyltransferase involved in cell wall biosynthesis